MSQYANEKTFDANLQRLGDLYEEGKDCLNGLGILEEDREDWSRVFDILREMRDIAVLSLKANHEIKPN